MKILLENKKAKREKNNKGITLNSGTVRNFV